MRRSCFFAALTILTVSLAGCGADSIQTKNDRPAASPAAASSRAQNPAGETVPDLPLMVYLDGTCLTDTGRKAVGPDHKAISPDAAFDGALISQVPAGEIPDQECQANFSCQNTPYLILADGAAAVKLNGQYRLFLAEDMVEYEGIFKKKEEVSEDTLQWLDFYYSMPEADRLAISMVPSEFSAEIGPAIAMETSDEAAVSYLAALTEEDLAETEALAMHYFTEVDISFEGVDQIYPVDADEGNYANAGIEGEYSPGNIVIYKVLTVKDRRDGNPFRFISIARPSKSDAWKVINSGY